MCIRDSTSTPVLRPATSYTILANAFKINGVNWPASTLTVNNSDIDIPQKLASSLEGAATGVHAQAFNQVKFDTSSLQYGRTLKINGVSVPEAGAATTLQGLIDGINLYKSQTQVEARLGDGGQLVLENTASQGGRDITLSSTPTGVTNVFGVIDQTYAGQVRLTRDLEDPKSSSLKIELGQNGSESMLQPTGLKLGIANPVILLPHPAELEGGRVPLPAQTKLIEAGSLVLNKVALPKLELTGNEGDTVQTMADWINSAKVPDVTAVAYNEVQLDPKKIDFSKDLYLNGAVISNAQSPVSNVAELINKIQAAGVGVRARLGELGQLIIENEPASQGKTITISGTSPAIGGLNALGLKSQAYTGMLRISRKISDPANSDLQLGFGANGKPAQLAALGLRTGAYFEGKAVSYTHLTLPTKRIV